MKNKKIVSMAAVIAASLSAAHAQFTAGNLVVLQDGTGSAPLSNVGTALYLDQFTTAPGGFVNALAIPSSGSSALVNSGTAGSEGQLSLSADGQYIVLAGYNATAGTASIASSTSATVPRGVATVDANGNYNLAGTTSSLYSGNNIRSATTDGSGNFWAAGAVGGVANMAPGTPSYISTTSVNNRLIQDIGGNLYFSTGSGSTRGIYKITGTPTSGANAATSFINTSSLGTVSPYGFAFNANLTIAYIADSDAYSTSAGPGGIEKWALVGSTWTFQYSLPVINTTGTTTTAGANGVAVDFSGANPVIYATSADGASLFDVVDTGASATDTLLDSAGANTAYRGLIFAPQPAPEPTILALAGLGGLAALVAVRRRK